MRTSLPCTVGPQRHGHWAFTQRSGPLHRYEYDIPAPGLVSMSGRDEGVQRTVAAAEVSEGISVVVAVASLVTLGASASAAVACPVQPSPGTAISYA